ncbi:MAG TPA: hypothetical protein VGB73_12475 [Pyrinomonadaceae bacterium]|jgi:hypothetical protein
MRKAINASVLVLALAFSVRAGDVLTPPAAQSTTTTEEQTRGEVLTPPEALLTLLNSVLSLL